MIGTSVYPLYKGTWIPKPRACALLTSFFLTSLMKVLSVSETTNPTEHLRGLGLILARILESDLDSSSSEAQLIEKMEISDKLKEIREIIMILFERT